jgi:beta-glucosidase
VDYATQARIPKASALWYRDFLAGQRRSRHAA